MSFNVFKSNFIHLKQGKLHYLRRENSASNNPALILLPGTYSDHRQFSEIVKNLPKNIDLLLLDPRGHGKSQPSPRWYEPLSIETLAKDVIKMMDDSKIQRSFISGHSLGGMTALEVGWKFSERIEGIITLEGWTNHKASATFKNYLFGPKSLHRKKDPYKAEVIRGWSNRTIKRFGNIWKKWNCITFLQTTNLPILSIWGDRGHSDLITNYNIRKSLFIPDRDNITLSWVTNSNHSLPTMKPIECAKLIENFMEEHKSSN